MDWPCYNEYRILCCKWLITAHEVKNIKGEKWKYIWGEYSKLFKNYFNMASTFIKFTLQLAMLNKVARGSIEDFLISRLHLYDTLDAWKRQAPLQTFLWLVFVTHFSCQGVRDKPKYCLLMRPWKRQRFLSIKYEEADHFMSQRNCLLLPIFTAIYYFYLLLLCKPLCVLWLTFFCLF